MPEAVESLTTNIAAADLRRGSTGFTLTAPARRGLLAGAAAFAGVVGGIARPGAAAPIAPQAAPIVAGPGAFMQAVAHFHACEAATKRMNAEGGEGWDDDAIARVSAAYDDAADAVADMPARNPPHLRANVVVLAGVLRMYAASGGNSGDYDDQADPHERFALNFVQDVLTMTGGAA